MVERARRPLAGHWPWLLGALLACQAEDVVLVPPPPDAGVPVIPGLLALEVRPNSAVVIDDGRGPPEGTVFRAFGSFEDGERDVSAEVAWTLAPPELGSVDRGQFQGAGLGGRGTVGVAAGDQSAQAELEVRLEVIEPGQGFEPGDVALFPSDTSSDTVDRNSLALAYPSHETELPRNLGSLMVEWSAAPDLDRFEILIESPVARIRYYSRVPKGRLDGAAWARLANTHAGSSVELSVRGLDSAHPQRIYLIPPISVGFSTATLPGAIYYWSSTTRAVMRTRIDAPLATRAFPMSGEDCAACHSVARDGRQMAYSEGGRLGISSLPEGTSIVPAAGAEAPRYEMGTYAPDGRRLLSARRGRLELFDTQSGASLGRISLPMDKKASQPDWSPDGSFVAIAYLDSTDGELAEHFGDTIVEGTSLAILPVAADGTLGPPQVLVASQRSDDTLSWPSVSPDGRLIAFVRARGRSKNNRRSELFLVRADGVGGPVSLARLNRRGGGRDTISEVSNGMPSWAASARAGQAWLAFGTVRPVGLTSTEQHDQLWMSAIDLARVSPGDDPSAAAFWLPFQSVTEANHQPIWSTDPTDVCASTVDICGNGRDDDCSGAADDACCTPGVEICGDQADNDCDGVVDEGCGCSLVENCTNGVDDDCDGDTDRDDEDCDD